MSKISLRETKDSAKLNLPDKIFHRIEVEMDEKQRVIYEKVRKDISIEIIKDGRLQMMNLILLL